MKKSIINVKPILKMKYQDKICYSKNPMAELYDMGLVTKVGNGLFVLEGVLVKIINKIESLISNIADLINARHVFVPCNLSIENAMRSKHLNSFSNQAIMLKLYGVNASNDKNIDKHEGLAGYVGIASPTVCYHYFSSLRGKKINGNYAITALSRCSRKERGKLDDLSRLENFTMREIVFFGSEKYCLAQREELLNQTIEILKSKLNLTFRVVTASDPFFGDESKIKKKAQLALESKYEIQALLPYNKKKISIASFNLHGKVFYERFKIIPKNMRLAFSGCAGWGYERLLYAILSQKGLDFSSSFYKKILL